MSRRSGVAAGGAGTFDGRIRIGREAAAARRAAAGFGPRNKTGVWDGLEFFPARRSGGAGAEGFGDGAGGCGCRRPKA